MLKTQAGATTVTNEQKGYWIDIGFTPQLEQWVRDPESNHGILLKAHNETSGVLDTFVQSDNGEKAPEPSLEVVYEPKLGNPGNEAMYQLPIGGGGTLGVNVANGNLHIADPDVRYSSEGYATEFARSYNSQDEELVGSSFGGAWRATMGEEELLYPSWWDESYALRQSDGSTTRFDRAPWADNHPSPGDKAYTGEAYVGAGLTVHENGTRTVNYNNGVELQFDNSTNGFPQKIIDPGGEGNTVSLYYTSSHLTKVKDTHGHELVLTREPSGHQITKIVGAGKGETWKYVYNKEGQLTSFTSASKEKVKYTYYKASGLLESIDDGEGTYVIVYDTSDRVSSLRKLVNGSIKKAGSEDEITTFSYETEQTTVTKPDGTAAAYEYDEYGNATEDTNLQETAVSDYAAYNEIESGAVAKADVDLQDHSAIVDTQLSEQLGEAYTGEWFNSGSGKIIIGLTSEGYEKTAEQDLDNLGLADNTEIVRQTATANQLQEESDTLESALEKLGTSGIIRTGTQTRTNQAVIEEASTITPTEESEVTSAVKGATVPVLVEKTKLASLAMVQTSAECSNVWCSAPLRGGVSIKTEFERGTHRTLCTLGFIAKPPYRGGYYAITAGHCITRGQGHEEGGINGKWESGGPEVGTAVGYVEGPLQHLPWGGTTPDRGDAGLIAINPSGEFGQGVHQPWLVVYPNSGAKTTYDPRYPIYRTHFLPPKPKEGVAPERYMVCVGGAPVRSEGREEGEFEGMEEPKNGVPYPAERCGETGRRFNEPEYKIKHLETFWQCDSKNTEGLGNGASGSPVYKYGTAYGIYVGAVKERTCEGVMEGINSIEGDFEVNILKAG